MADSYFVDVHGISPGGPTIALALIEPAGLVLRVAEKPDLRLAYAELSVSVDPENPERVLLRAPSLGAAWVAVDDRRVAGQIAALAPAEFREQWASLQDGGRRERRERQWRRGAALALAAVLTVAAAAWGYGELVSYVVAKIPVRLESQLGALAGDGVDKGALADPAVVDAVDRVSGRLLKTLAQSPYTFKIVVLPDARVNAFALPGGRIVVYSGLIAQAETPDELAGVLAHEMQHVLRRHSLRGLVRQLGVRTLCAVVFSGGGDAAQTLGAFAPDLIGLRFDRAQEAEADSGGMDMLFAAGIPGDGMVRFFQRMSTKESGAARAINFAADHPTSARRFEDLERLRLSRPAPPPVDWGLDWALVRERARAATPAKPDAAPKAGS